jgi:SP family sugar:H+ symporter-like MFS transporter
VTGINFFFSYGVQFAQAAGLANTYVFQIILASVNVAASFPGVIAVDRAGRRPVLLTGAATMFIGQIVVGSVSKAYPDNPIAGDVLIAFTCLFVAAFASSWGPVAWVVCGETFPIRLSSLCVTLGTGANWLFNLIIAFAAPQIQARIGTGICFVWAGCLALAFAFAFFCIPETKGMSIEE